MPKRANKNGAERNLVVVSDTHCGCQLGLCPPGPIYLDSGPPVAQSRLQATVWGWWREFWDEWVPRVTKGEPFAVVFNGDALDGVHHGSTTQITHNLADQHKIAYACLKPVVDACGGRYYHIRGTEAHVGPSAAQEEMLAQALGAIPTEDGKFSRWELRKRIPGENGGHLCHFSHHIGVTSSANYESTALLMKQVQSFVQAGKWGDEPPQVIVRAHRHRHMQVSSSGRKGYYIVAVTPGWQLTTPFGYRKAKEFEQPEFGGILIRAGDEELHSRYRVWRLDPPQEE